MGTYDIALQVDVAAEPAAVYAALTTTDGVAGWWTARNESRGEVGETSRFRFPDAPMSWDMRIVEAVPGKALGWHCTGGPPPWIGTDVSWALAAAPDGGTRVGFDHTGFAAKDEMFRVVTMGWAQMILRLKQYAEGGVPVPFFDF